MIVLIPAYEPDIRLIELIRVIKEHCNFKIIVVDDGSGSAYSAIFDEALKEDCHILTHKENCGKGRALKTGFSYILENTDEKDGVVTADADGQHIVPDILHVASEITSADRIVLGARRFIGRVPARSVFGNYAMRLMFTVASGNNIWDTQTGLRGFPISMLPLMLKLDGERFEYEMNMLLEAGPCGYGFKQLYIDTVYISGNKSSHFNPILDSIRVCIPFFKFCLSSISAAVVDFVLLFVFQWLFNILPLSVVLARAASSLVNYTINRTLVFNSKLSHVKPKSKALNYYILVVCLLVLNYLILSFFSQIIGIELFWSKLITETLLFTVSYSIQRFILFKKPIVQPE